MAAGLGPDNLDADLTIDIDFTIRQAYGTQKHGCAFGYTKVRGYHPLLATLSQTGEALHVRLRGCNAGLRPQRDQLHHRDDQPGTRSRRDRPVDDPHGHGRWDSKAVIGACRKADVRFSITVPMNKSIRKAIDAIPDDAWTPIPYWQEGGADVAEVPYPCFSGKHSVQVRLIVRQLRPTPGSQLALDVVSNYHARWSPTAKAPHWRWRSTIAITPRSSWSSVTSKDGPLAHLPSGVFNANAPGRSWPP